MIIWHTLPDHIPFDGQHCWVRVKYYYSEPFEAYYSVASQEWISADGGIVYPAWSVARWAAWYPPAPIAIIFQSVQTPLNTLTITLKGVAGYACVITWGDTTETSFSFTGSDQVITHTYTSTGTYNVTLICFADVLLKLYVNAEPLTGGLPDLLYCSNFEYINLINTHVDGPLWSAFPFPSLNYLNMQGCDLTGTLPALNNMPLLTYINLGNNSFTGSLPDPSPCPLLTSYRFVQCGVSGSIPDFSNNLLLTAIRLDLNNLTGSLPSLAHLPLLANINVDNNDLSGTIPSFTGCLALANIVLRGNNFTDYEQSDMPLVCNEVYYDNNALTVSAVNQILADFAANLASRPAAGVLTLNGGTNAAPTGQGLIDKAAIIAHGWTCVTN